MSPTEQPSPDTRPRQMHVLAAAALLLLGAYLCWRELPTAMAESDLDALVAQQFAEGTRSLPLAYRSGRNLLLVCWDLPDRQHLGPDPCAAIAAEQVRRMPTDAFAWVALARAAGAAGDDRGFISALERSYVTGPNEGWIARRRINLVRRFGTVPQPLAAGHAHDLALVLR